MVQCDPLGRDLVLVVRFREGPYLIQRGFFDKMYEFCLGNCPYGEVQL